MKEIPTDRIPFTAKVRIPWRVLLSIVILGILVHFLVYMYKYGSAGIFRYENVVGNFRMLFVYFLPFECISITIIILLIQAYHNVLKIKFISYTIKGIAVYELSMLPLFAGSIFLFGPVTNFFRYLFLRYPDYGWQFYYPDYFFDYDMYFNYLVPTLTTGYILININLFIRYREWQNDQLTSLTDRLDMLTKNGSPVPAIPGTTPVEINSIVAFDGDGQTELALRKVCFFIVENRHYLAHTTDKTYSVHQTLLELDAVLPIGQFYRINRSAIINLAYFKSYAYWENDKYIIRLIDEKTTFIMQRARLKDFKERLKASQTISS